MAKTTASYIRQPEKDSQISEKVSNKTTRKFSIDSKCFSIYVLDEENYTSVMKPHTQIKVLNNE